MRFDLDEPLFPPEDARPGIHTGPELDELHAAWGAAKIDEWCAVSALTRAAAGVRSAVAAPATAPISAVLTVAETRAAEPMVARALAAYRDAAASYEGARTDLADIRRRAHTRAAA